MGTETGAARNPRAQGPRDADAGTEERGGGTTLRRWRYRSAVHAAQTIHAAGRLRSLEGGGSIVVPRQARS